MNLDDIVFVLWGINFTWEGIGIMIAAVFSVLSCVGNIVVFFYEKKKISIQYITEKKICLINTIQESSIEYAATVMDLCMKPVITDEDLKNLIKEEYNLRIYLNRDSIPNQQVKQNLKLLKQIRNSLHKGEFDNAKKFSDSFIDDISVYLKMEWDNAKNEVKKTL